MENNDRSITKLKQERRTLKAQITSLKNYINKNKNNLNSIKIQLKLRFDKVKSLFDKFDEVHNSLEIMDPDGNHNIEHGIINDSFFEVSSNIHKILDIDVLSTNNSSRSVSVSSDVSQNSGNLNSSNKEPTNKRRIKLPQINLPTFSGKYEEWISFKDTFESLIIKDQELTDVEKLTHLKSVVIGDAARKINIFSMKSVHFTEAWNLLIRAYENKRLIISRHLTLLLTLPAVDRDSYEDLCKLVDYAQQHVRSLKNLGIEINTELLVKVIEMRLPHNILSKWDETLIRDKYPTFDDIVEFVYKIATHLSMRNEFTVSSEESGTKRRISNANNNFAKRMKTSHKESSFLLNTKFKCICCSESEFHYLFRCKKFISLSPSMRLKIVKEAGFCTNCMRSKHKISECNFGNCTTCDERHNTLLHIEKNIENL